MSLPESEGRRPDVLFVTTDDLRPALGCCGDPRARTRHPDRPAAAVFMRAHYQQAWCAPSRASLLTGLWPDTTGVRDLDTHFRVNIPDAVTLCPQRRADPYDLDDAGETINCARYPWYADAVRELSARLTAALPKPR